ncbi:DUF2085 domain-containing protein [bacterium]|nr:DUF2085 domain-containing protein [bacterium]
MYTLLEIQNAWQMTTNPLLLRGFIGNPEMGWKVAWSDRMVSMYTSILFVSWIWYPFRKKLSGFQLWAFILFIIPMALDGTTHMVSDIAGIGQGFRDHNTWLAEITNFKYAVTFYTGENLGSFNSWMRLISGISFGIGVVLFGFPYLNEIYEDNLSRIIENQNQLRMLKDNALQDLLERNSG